MPTHTHTHTQQLEEQHILVEHQMKCKINKKKSFVKMVNTCFTNNEQNGLLFTIKGCYDLKFSRKLWIVYKHSSIYWPLFSCSHIRGVSPLLSLRASILAFRLVSCSFVKSLLAWRDSTLACRWCASSVTSSNCLCSSAFSCSAASKVSLCFFSASWR